MNNRSHATYDGYLCKIRKWVKDNEKVDQGSELVAYGARLVNPKGSYIGAPKCSLYWLSGYGYIAADIRPARD